MAISIGLRTDTHVMICSETTLAESIIKIKENDNNTCLISNTLVNITGEQAESFRLQSYGREYSKLLSLENRIPITPSLVSRILSERIHSKLRDSPINCQAIVGGLSDTNAPELYCIDRYGACHEDRFCVTGYGQYFMFGIYDMLYRKDMSEEESMDLITKCLKVMKERLVIETNKWKLDVIGADGARTEFIDLN